MFVSWGGRSGRGRRTKVELVHAAPGTLGAHDSMVEDLGEAEPYEWRLSGAWEGEERRTDLQQRCGR